MVSSLELRRQAFHLLEGITIVLLFHYGLLGMFGLSLILLAHFIFSLIMIRWRLPVFSWFLEKFDRDEKLPGKGSLTYLIGVYLALRFFYFDPDIAYASILILAFGDSFSHVFGQALAKARSLKKIQNPLNKKKLIEGTIMGIIAAGLAASVFVSMLEAFAAAFVAMALEAIEIRLGRHIIDDNIMIPVVAGTVIFLVRLLYF